MWHACHVRVFPWYISLSPATLNKFSIYRSVLLCQLLLNGINLASLESLLRISQTVGDMTELANRLGRRFKWIKPRPNTVTHRKYG
jgi:hypothetical protein